VGAFDVVQHTATVPRVDRHPSNGGEVRRITVRQRNHRAATVSSRQLLASNAWRRRNEDIHLGRYGVSRLSEHSRGGGVDVDVSARVAELASYAEPARTRAWRSAAGRDGLPAGGRGGGEPAGRGARWCR